MTDATAEFFDALAQRGHDPMLGRFKGSVRFDVKSGNRTEHFRVAFKQGDITVTHDEAEADCVVRADRSLLNACAAGEKNIMAAFLRGEIAVQGDPQLLVLFQRILPGRKQSEDALAMMDAERSES
jgi:putative sterol carrier protein